MGSEQPHIVIAGGGMVGISLALRLARMLPEETQLTLIESVPMPGPDSGHGSAALSAYHPSFDARSTALSYSTHLIYSDMGIWSGLQEWLCPIEKIHVSTRGRFGSSELRASDYAWSGLGWVVENAWLGQVLLAALQRESRVAVRSPQRVLNAYPDGARLQLQLSGDAQDTLQADLLVVADGARSGLRTALGIGASEKDYGQQALVANIAFARAHRGCAYERFTGDGPLALLPLLPTEAAPHRASLVWTLPPERAERLRACPADEFLATLREAFGYRMGRPVQVGERHTYPLALLEARETVRRHVVVVGNAAHALHPVAGQGFNLALRDVAVLGDVLAAAGGAGESPGDIAVLERYRQRQLADQQRTIAVSDALPALFMQGDPLLALARDLALSSLDVAGALKRQFVRHAAGVAALEAGLG